jgi:hypothetical protein
MKKVQLFVLVLMFCAVLFGCASRVNGTQPQKEERSSVEQQQTNQSGEKAVLSLVENFGSKLQLVSLQADIDTVKKSMQENYADFVSQELLAKWQSDPQSAPGRLTSSPWPDHIEILSAEKLSEYEYEVKGEIIEITSTEKDSGGIAAKRPITLRIKKVDNRWLIDNALLGGYEESDSIVYKNIQYGFTFSLPGSWKNYKIVTDKWKGLAVGSAQGEELVETGPMASIRHPEWTAENPRQDIPIMIFTMDQWNKLQEEKFHIGAAPIGPSEYGRNSRYVFALPARYNFAFPTGYEEVENILKNGPLHPILE